jgi:hypothetical protein
VVVYQALEFIDIALSLIHNDVVVNRTSSALNGGMGRKIEIIFERMRYISLNKGTRQGVVVTVSGGGVTLLWEEADVMALSANDDCKFNLQNLLTSQTP